MLSKKILLLILCAIAVIAIISFNDAYVPNKITKDYVESTLNRYIENKNYDNDFFPANADTTTNPRAFTYATANAQAEIAKFLEDNSGEDNEPNKLNGIDFVKYISNVFVLSTEFEDKIQINGYPRKDQTNIYFLKEDDGRLAKHFENNCSFIGLFRAIICDAKFVRETIKRLQTITKTYDIVLITPDGPVDLAENHEMQKLIVDHLLANFITCLRGHEIGHAIHHHAYVVEEGLNLHFDFDYDEKEKSADAFVAETILLSEGDASQFKTVLGEFIQQEYRNQYRKSNDLKLEELEKIDERDFPLTSNLNISISRYRVPLLTRRCILWRH